MARGRMFSYVFISLVLPPVLCVSQPRVKVTTTVGHIIGLEQSVFLLDGSNHMLDVYLGIPYACPPVGNLRFRKPQPVSNFTRPFKADHFGDACPQEQAAGNMSEDCLTLNIYAPKKTTESAPFPVIIWIHGGAFMSGEGRQLPGEGMAAFGEIIVVTVNYRLGALGFLATDDEEAAGNVGLWDQRLALKWVSKNIAYFGGDTDRVTLAGTSSGAVCVAYHALYSQNDGLFHRILLDSGTAISFGSFNRKGLKYAKALADTLDCGLANSDPSLSRKIVTCLRGKDFQSIVSANVRPDLPFILTWAPVADGDFIVEDPTTVVTWPASDATISPIFRSVDAMIGTKSADGSELFDIWVNEIAASQNESAKGGVSERLFESVVDLLMKASASVREDVSVDVTEAVTQAVLQEYSEWFNPMDSALRARNLIGLLTEQGFFVPSAIFTRNHAVKSNNSSSTFMYLFDERAPIPPTPNPWRMGSLHKDHDIFVLGLPETMRSEISSPIHAFTGKFSKAVTTYWSNFVKTGNPNSPQPVKVEWPPFMLPTEDYLYLDLVQFEPASRYQAKITAFWTDYIPKLRMSVTKCKRKCLSDLRKVTNRSPIMVNGFIVYFVTSLVLCFMHYDFCC